jgi:hypothetical protein
VWTRALAIAVIIAGCSGGEPIRDWTLDDGTHVTLPASLLAELPLSEFHIHANVALREELRGETLTIAFDCLHSPLSLAVNGVAIADIGDIGVGEHRFILPPERTRDARLALDVHAVHDVLALNGFGTAPRLVRGAATEPGLAARFNRDTALAELGLIVVFALMFGVSFGLDRRRRQDAAFAAGVLFAAVAPMWQLGVIRELGDWGSILLGVGVAGTQVAALAFLYATFELGALPKWIAPVYGVLVLGNFSDWISLPIAVVEHVLYSLVSFWFFVYASKILVDNARAGRHRHEARLLLITLACTMPILIPDLIGFAIGHNLLGGAHMVSTGVITCAIAQSLALVRQQASRQRALEKTAAELQHQIGERSRELADALARLSQRTHALESDRIIDARYRIVRRVGSGGMGAVYEVERLSDGERLALKTLRGRVDTGSMARFAREAQIAAQISHPNLIPVLDVGVSDEGLFLVMPLVTGGSLEQARSRFGDAAWARPILRQIAEGMAALHARGIVHRDLKPGNVLLDDGVARITDFGLSSLHAEALTQTLAGSTLGGDAFAATASPDPSPPLTRAGDLFGTPAYMAPELAEGVQEGKPASDIFAFGVIAHELVTGRSAFIEPPVIARLHGRPIEKPSINDLLFARCLDTEPANRPTAAELVTALSTRT